MNPVTPSTFQTTNRATSQPTIQATDPDGLRRPVRSPWAGVAALSAAGLLVLATAGPAAAHDQLISATPAAGTAVIETPTELNLTFSGNLITGQGISNLATVTGEDGHQWQAGDVSVSGPELTAPLCEGMPNGEYSVDYRVVYSDGHSEEKGYEFTLEDPGAPETGVPTDCGVVNPDAPVSSEETGSSGTAPDAPATAPGASASATGPTVSDAPASGVDGPTAEPATEAAEPGDASAGVPGWVWPAAIGGVLVIALAMLLVFRKVKGIDSDADRT